MEIAGDFVGLVRDQRFHQLKFAEQFILWSVRMWLRAYCRGSNLFTTLHEAFEVIGISEAGKSFDNGMAIITVGTRCDLLFLGVDSQYVSQDEGDFLEVLAAFQRGETERALARLDVWLPVSGTRIAGPAFEEFACCLAKSGLSIGSRQEKNSIQYKLRKFAITGARLH